MRLLPVMGGSSLPVLLLNTPRFLLRALPWGLVRWSFS